MANDSSQKTEKPTPKRLNDARKKGQIPRSVDLVQWITLLLASFILPPILTRLLRQTGTGTARLIELSASGETGPVLSGTSDVVRDAVLGLLPLFGFVVATAIIGMAAQGGLVITGHPLKPKWERVSPKAGFKRIFSVQSVVETAKAVLRLAVLGVLVATTLFAAARDHLLASGLSLGISTELLVGQLVLVLRLGALVGAVIGMADYAFQRWQSMRKLKMSLHEVKEEHRNTDGDPSVKGRRRSAHAKLTRNQMLTAVKDASVVVVNPQHYAVALAYSNDGKAPVVVAKGTEELALRIRERARIDQVPIVEAPPLARALHAIAEVGQSIPEDFFEAVAIVLAFVLRPRGVDDSIVHRVTIPSSKVPIRDDVDPPGSPNRNRRQDSPTRSTTRA
ncbi:MAG: flagellar biosynthetic protein FlhB [Acidimicrobiales bacterium]